MENVQTMVNLMMKKITKEQFALGTEMSKMRAFDRLFIDTGVEQEDILKAFITYDLEESEEFKLAVSDAREQCSEKIRQTMQRMKTKAKSQGATANED